LNSIILPGTTLNELIADIKDFLEMENWYMSVGIPHRRGYLLHGPPGTGKSELSNFLSSLGEHLIFLKGSTIHAVAGELRMEVYSISLAAHL